MQGSIETRIRKNAKDAQGKMRKALKVYDVRYNAVDSATGEVKRKKKRGFLLRSAAEAFLVEINRKQAEGCLLIPETLLVKDYLHDWLDSYVKINVRESTYIGYKRIIEKHLLPYIGGIDMKKLTALQVDKLYAELLQHGRADGAGGLSQKSVQYTHRVLNEAMEHAVKKSIIIRNPVKAITNTPKPKKYHAEIYTAEELLHLLRLSYGTFYEVPIALAGICGLRRGECLGMQLKCVDFGKKIICVNKQIIEVNNEVKFSEPKSADSVRTISVPDEVLEIIRRREEVNQRNRHYLGNEYHDWGLIVCHDDGTPFRPGTFTHDFANLLKKHEMKKIRFHDLRHSCASLMLKSGVAMKTASEILGHSSIAITADLYTHVLQEAKEKAAQQVGAAIFGKQDDASVEKMKSNAPKEKQDH